MNRIELGKSGLFASRIGLGLAALGRPGYINIGHSEDLRRGLDVDAMESHAHAVLDLAWESGIRYFDAARSYGRAEEFLARWLDARKIDPGAVTVGSKWGYTYTAGWKVDADRHEVKDHSLATLERQVSESRSTIGGHLGLYQIHSATLESGVLDDRTVLEALGRLRDGGLIIGLSLTGPRQAETLRKALGITIGGRGLFGAVQATWNLLERSSGPALAEAHEAGLGVIIKETLANGRLTDRNDDPGFARARSLLDREANRLGTRPDALAISAVLARPWVDVALSGAGGVEQLRSNFGAISVAWDERAEVALQAITEEPESYWTTRSRLPWN
ncbi:aldo/keto reductase [Tundrisphaera lichenicola]|uniref:aldo/keto reductase n=1 Tax=Tundrisphaera lichenicola TaxID=2029860 RepID=UPI003EB8191B